MSKHTPEPWHYIGDDFVGVGANCNCPPDHVPDEPGVIYGLPDHEVHPVVPPLCDEELGDGMDMETQQANCRRIVAAVNACAGIPIAALEAGVIAGLLAACKRLDEVDCCEGYTLGDDSLPAFWDALGMARAALAKAKGGAI